MKVTGLSRVSKDNIIRQVETEIKSRKAFIIVQHGTVSALAMDKLRLKLFKADSRYMAVKNSLGRQALKKAGLESLVENVSGASGITFAGNDIVASSKILVDFAKENESFKIRAGYMNGRALDPNQIKALASLPPREVLIAKAVGMIKAPLAGLVNVLSGNFRKLVYVLDAVSKKKAAS